MSEYSFNLNTDLYKYSKPVYITEPTGTTQTFIPVKFNLNSGNFNFDTPRSDGLDFRLAERSNGTGVLQMWISYWDYQSQTATIWFKLPELLASETRTMYAFWGFAEDTGISDLRHMMGEATGDPVYTSDLALGVSTSGSSGGAINPDNLFDGNDSSYCDLGLNDYAQCNFTTPTKINKLTLSSDTSGANPYGFKLSASNDDFVSEDVQITSVQDLIGIFETHEYFFGNETEYLHYRITNNTGVIWWRAIECEMMGIDESASTSTPVFLFADDFDAAELDVNKWYTSNGTWTIANSTINLDAGSWIRCDALAPLAGVINWIVEEGIVGVGSPTSTTTAAHIYRFYGGYNILGINYYWDGSTDRYHDFVNSESYITYSDANRGLIEGSYSLNHIAYYEPTDRVYQGMTGRAGSQAPVYGENLFTDGDKSIAFDYPGGFDGDLGPPKAIDGDPDTRWLDTEAGANEPTWWGYEFDTELAITRIQIDFGYANTHFIQVSNSIVPDWDSKIWTNLYEAPFDNYYLTSVDYEFDNTEVYKYIRIYMPSGSGPSIYETRAFSTIDFSSESDYEDSWERKVNRNTEVEDFSIHGESSSTAEGVEIDWVVVREYNPDAEPAINYGSLYVEHEYAGHQQLDDTAYQSDVTSVDFYHFSDMGGDPYRMSDNITNSITNIFISDGSTTSGSLMIDFGRRRDGVTDNDYIHFNSDNTVAYYNAAKLSDLDSDVHGRDYWLATTTSGWAAIQFPNTIDISCLTLTAVPGSTAGMPDNFKFYGSQSDPRFSGWNDKVLIYEGTARSAIDQQAFYFSTGLTFYKYYILEVIDTHGANIAIQEWGMYERDNTLGKKVISQLRLYPVTFTDNEYHFVKEIELYGSNDGFNWDLLIPIIDTPTPFTDYAYGRWSRYSFENFTGYYIYKLMCYDNWHAANDQIKIAEWEMVETVSESDSIRILAGATDDINNIWADPDTTISSGTMYLTNDMFNVVEYEKLINYYDTELPVEGYWQETDQLTADLTDGGTATEPGEPYNDDPTYLISQAFDSSLSTYWHSKVIPSWPFWAQYEFSTTQKIVYVRMYPRDSFTSRMPGDFIIKGSNTGLFTGEEVDIVTIVGATYSNGQWTEFNFTNDNSYLYYRFHITAKAVGSGTGDYMNIFEIEMKGYTLEYIGEVERGPVIDFNIKL